MYFGASVLSSCLETRLLLEIELIANPYNLGHVKLFHSAENKQNKHETILSGTTEVVFFVNNN